MSPPAKEAALLAVAALFAALALSFINRGGVVYHPPTPPESLYQGTPLGYRVIPLDLKGDDDDSSETSE